MRPTFRKCFPLVVLVLALGATRLIAQPLPPSSATGASQVERLSWLAGSWVHDSLGTRNEEHWMLPRAGLMVGMSRTVTGSRVRSFEFLRIQALGDSFAYLASPGGRAPTTFMGTKIGDRRVEFENPRHDFPQRILYWLDDDRLRARVEGMLQGKRVTEDYAWRRDSLSP